MDPPCTDCPILRALERKIGEVSQTQRSCVRRLDGVEVDMDGSALRLGEIVEWIRRTREGADRGGDPKRPPGIADLDALERGVARVDFLWMPDGGARVTIDGTVLHLPPAPAHLLSILVDGGGEDREEGPGWKSLDHIAARLTQETGRRYERGSKVNMVFYRLRAKFKEAGLSAYLVQRDRRGYARFALRRNPGGPRAQ